METEAVTLNLSAQLKQQQILCQTLCVIEAFKELKYTWHNYNSSVSFSFVRLWMNQNWILAKQ